MDLKKLMAWCETHPEDAAEEIRSLRSRLVISDAMVERAAAAMWADLDETFDEQSQDTQSVCRTEARRALEAALKTAP